MSTELKLPAEGLTVAVQLGRRGVQVGVAGVLTLAPNQAWDDSVLVVALLDAQGAVLSVERDGLRFEEATGHQVFFSESCRLPPALAERVAWAEVWVSAVAIELTEIGSLDIPAELPEPMPGQSTQHTVGDMSVRRPSADSDGDCRLLVYGRCAFDGHSAYDTRAELRASLVDADGATLYSDDGSFETMMGRHGAVFFDCRFRPHVDQIASAQRLELQLITKRLVASERVRIPRKAFALVEDD